MPGRYAGGADAVVAAYGAAPGGFSPVVPPAGRTWLAVDREAVPAVAAPDVFAGAYGAAEAVAVPEVLAGAYGEMPDGGAAEAG